MSWFNKKDTAQEYINSVITVATNLYLNTLSGEHGIATTFEFQRYDSRFRYLIFCCSTVVLAVLAYEEQAKIQRHVLITGCLQFLNWSAEECADEYFSYGEQKEYSIVETADIFKEYLQAWSLWPELESQEKDSEIIDLICKIIHSAESEKQITTEDTKRLEELALEIDCRMPTMRGAVEELAGK